MAPRIKTEHTVASAQELLETVLHRKNYNSETLDAVAAFIERILAKDRLARK